MRVFHGFTSILSLSLALWLFHAADWPPLHAWYAHVYLGVFAAAVLLFLISCCKSFLAVCVVSACGKFIGIIFLAWLRWGYQAQWMCGWFGIILIVVMSFFYVIGLPISVLYLCSVYNDSDK